MFPYEVEVQQRQEVAGVIPADHGDDGLHLRVEEHVVDVGDTVLRGVRDVAG